MQTISWNRTHDDVTGSGSNDIHPNWFIKNINQAVKELCNTPRSECTSSQVSYHYVKQWESGLDQTSRTLTVLRS